MEIEGAAERNANAFDRETRAAVAGDGPPDHASGRFYVLMSLGMLAVLTATNPFFNAVDDECAIIGRAAKPAGETVALFVHGVGEHEHPPLYDLILHGWLVLTRGEIHLLRLPATIFYVLGAVALAKAAQILGGRRSEVAAFVMVAVWPYGFHFGRLAAWYSFCFLIVSWLTLNYLKWVRERTRARWLWVLLAALALVYSNYFGWAIVGCLGLDFVIRNRKNLSGCWRPLAGTAAVLVICYLPLIRVLLAETGYRTQTMGFGVASAATAIFNLYCLFVSESVAPWFWGFGVTAGIAIAVTLWLTVVYVGDEARLLLVYFLALLFAMAVMGIVETKRMMFIAPWLILPISAGFASRGTRPNTRRALAGSLAVVCAIGWYGIFARNLYAAPRWVEPWSAVADQAATVVRNGGTVIGNNPSFFFYLTYRVPAADSGRGFQGLLPDSVRRPGVYTPEQWLREGHPLAGTVLLVKGQHYGTPAGPTEESESRLDGTCSLTNVQRLVPDPGAKWKRRYLWNIAQPDWRVEVRTYGCP